MPVARWTDTNCSPALLGRYGLMYGAKLSGSASPSAGSTSSSPNKVAMAPAVCRMIQPSATPSRPTAVEYSPAPITARSTPGADRVVWMCWELRNAWPPKNAANELSVVTTKVTAANTTSFAHSTGSLLGAADRLARIIPVLYSPVTTSAPSTPTTNWAKVYPLRAMSVGLKRAWRAALMNGHRPAVSAANTQPSTIIPANVAAKAIYDERKERNFSHSEWIT